MAADSWLNKHGNTVRDVCYTSMSTVSNIQEKYVRPQSAPCCSLPQFPAVLPHHTAESNSDTHRTGAGTYLGSWSGSQAGAPATPGHGMTERKRFWRTLVGVFWPSTKPTVRVFRVHSATQAILSYLKVVTASEP